MVRKLAVFLQYDRLETTKEKQMENWYLSIFSNQYLAKYSLVKTVKGNVQ